jgi:hypothetical protein
MNPSFDQQKWYLCLSLFAVAVVASDLALLWRLIH